MPKVWVIIIGVMVTPALYAWLNINAFWDPYGNTGNIPVAVVNQDRGASSPVTGQLNIGKSVVDELKKNDQLGWQFMSPADAQDAVERGDVFSTIEIPPRFSQDFISMFQGTYSQPTLVYRPNEKLSAIGPKITDQGASTIDEKITAQFKEQVGKSASSELRRTGNSFTGRLDRTQGKAAAGLDETAETLANSQDTIARMQDKLAGAAPTIAATKDVLRATDQTLQDATRAAQEISDTISTVQRGITDFADSASTAYLEGTTALADGTANANTAVSGVTSQLDQLGGQLSTATSQAERLINQSDQAINQLEGMLGAARVAPPLADQLRATIEDLKQRSAANRSLVDSLSATNQDASATTTSIRDAADALATATADTRDSAAGLRDAMGTTLPKLNEAMSKLSATAGGLTGTLDDQRVLLRQASDTLDSLSGQLERTGGVLKTFGDDLKDMEGGVRAVRADVLALNLADEGPLKTVRDLDPSNVGTVLSTPTKVENKPVFPVNTYGSGMAALFTNLALWIGAFMLMVIFRVEVDREGLGRGNSRRNGHGRGSTRHDGEPRITVGQAFRGRLMLLAMLVTVQALVIGIGDLVIGVQTVNPVAFVGTCVLIGLAYLSIIYSLVVAFGHIGRGLVVALAFIQIPGASGMYPIEMMPDFFQLVYPLLPFSYGIDTLRETIGGFYSTHYWKFLGILWLMAIVALIAGGVLRRMLSNVNLLFNRQLRETGLLQAETVQVVGSGYRLTDIIRAIQAREGNDAVAGGIGERADHVRRTYPRWMRLTAIVGFAGIVVLGLLSHFRPVEKALVFALACGWGLLILAIIGTLEYTRQSVLHAQELQQLDDDELDSAVSAHSAHPREYTLNDAPGSRMASASSTGAASTASTPDGGRADSEEDAR